MSSIWIQGNQCIRGEITVQGCKNAVLPMMAAALLTDDAVTLDNCPQILDTDAMALILEQLGCRVVKRGHEIVIMYGRSAGAVISEAAAGALRASGVLLGALIATGRSAVLPKPGGCTIGARPMNLHIRAFQELGYTVREHENYLYVDGAEHAHAARVHLSYPSVGATENAMMASVLLNGTTEILGAAREPEVEDLAHMLCAMGANIQGAGQDVIRIEGVSWLHGVRYRIMPDRIAAGTYLLSAAATGGEIEVREACPEHLTMLLRTLREMNCRIYSSSDRLYLKAPEGLKPGQIRTGPYPQYPTDLQAVMMAAMLKSQGLSVIRETVFESRYRTAAELVKMGADIRTEGGLAMIHGGKPLHGAVMEAPDLRGGAALVIAGMLAQGPSKIEHAERISRGYEDIVASLKRLGVRSHWG